MNRSHLSIFIAVLTVLGCSGCSRRTPSATVVLVDPSANVTERGRKDEFAAVAALIPRMQRGDLLTVIPITGNAAADIEGRILRLHAPEHRETYDDDVRQFRRSADTQYAEFVSSLLAHSGRRTDIIGALNVAWQEFDVVPTSDRRRLIVLSDFIENDGLYRFTTDKALIHMTRPGKLDRRELEISACVVRLVPVWRARLRLM